MAWTIPKLFVAGNILTAAELNTYLSDNDTALRSGGIAIASQAALDFIYASSGSQLARLAKGAAYTVPRMNSGASAWEFAKLSIVQVLRATTTTEQTTTGSTYVSSGLSQSITLSNAAHKVAVLLAVAGISSSGSAVLCDIQMNMVASDEYVTTQGEGGDSASYFGLETPGSVGPHTYTMEFRRAGSAGTAYVQRASRRSSLILMEVAP